MVSLVDDGSIVFTRGSVRVEGSHFLAIRPDERLDVVLVDECVIRGDARLASVEQLAESGGRRRLTQGVAFGDDDRRFTAQFKGDGDKIVARSLHHRSADCSAPSEDQMVERQGRECRPYRRIAGHNRELVLGEYLAEHFCE